MQKEIPILFSTDMVQAILAGRKTQTRRIVKPQPIDNTEVDGNFFEGNHKGYVKVDGHPEWREQFAYEFAKWKVGDVLWVRETWCYHVYMNSWKPGDIEQFVYKADLPPVSLTIDDKWEPSIHMPKNAARIWLRVTGIRVERLQDITETDACQEGVKESDLGFYQDYLMNNNTACDTAKESFQSLWQAINGNWHHNPWLWVISFEVLSTTGRPENL